MCLQPLVIRASFPGIFTLQYPSTRNRDSTPLTMSVFKLGNGRWVASSGDKIEMADLVSPKVKKMSEVLNIIRRCFANCCDIQWIFKSFFFYVCIQIIMVLDFYPLFMAFSFHDIFSKDSLFFFFF